MTVSAVWEEESKDLGKGMIGLKNQSYYCYMNAVLQTFVAIVPMRDYFLGQKYAATKGVATKKNSFEFSNSLYTYYKRIWKAKDDQPGDLSYLKTVVEKKFCPVMMHDGHEFLMYMLANL